jgi:hypothetical protein
VESVPGLVPAAEAGKPPFPQRYWYARTGGAHPATYLAVFNLSDDATKSDLPWMVFRLPNGAYAVFNVWNQKHVPSAKTLHVELAPHGCALFRVE